MSPLDIDNLVALTIQAAAVAMVGAPLPRLLGLRSPRARLAYWRLLLLACLLLPALQHWQPRPPEVLRVGPALTESVSADVTSTSGSTRLSALASWSGFGVLDLLALGIAGRAAWFVAGLGTLARLRRRSSALDPRPGSVVDAIGLAGVYAEFRMDAAPSRPVTFGFLRPVVVVPSDFEAFDPEQQKAIACHELTHVRRRDWVRNLGDELVRAVAWFHPAAWWLTRQIRLAREEVVDQEVVRQIGARKPYLDALLRLASPDRGSLLVPAPLFLGRSHLSDRIALLLKEVRMSRPRLVVTFVVMAAVLLAAGRVIVSAFPLQGPPQQAVGASRPGEMTSPQKPEVKVPGRVKTIAPVFPPNSPAAVIVVNAQIDATGAVSGAALVSGPADLGDVALAAVRQWKFAPGRASTLVVGFNPAASSGALADQPPVFVGGQVKPPAKIFDKRPVYPEDAKQEGAQGIVILETRLAADGQVSEARVVRSVSASLDAAAIDAVLAWKFTPRGLPLQMTVTVNFTLQHDDQAAKGVAGGVGGGVAGGVGGGVAGGVAGSVAGAVAGSVAAGARTVLHVGDDIAPPKKIVDVKPVYPKAAQEARVEGIVLIDTTIGPDGKVTDTKIVRSVPELDQAALDAVRQWEFVPTLLNGNAVSVVMTITVNFTLQ